MSFKNSSETRHAARGHALRGGTICGQPPSRVRRHQGDTLVGALPKSKGSPDRAAPAPAEAGADSGPIRLSAPARVVVARRLGGRQRALLSGVYRGKPGAPPETPV